MRAEGRRRDGEGVWRRKERRWRRGIGDAFGVYVCERYSVNEEGYLSKPRWHVSRTPYLFDLEVLLMEQ